MNPTEKYFLLKKNNNLQTIESLINPYVFESKDKVEAMSVKQKLELRYLRNVPIHFHFDHLEVVCDEEMINFDKFLIDNYQFSFLTDGFNHSKKSLNGQILYDQKFPDTLLDEELLSIQAKMDKYHFELIEQEANSKSIIILNPWNIDNPLRDGEFFQLTEFYDSQSAANNFIRRVIEAQFDLDGTRMTVGDIRQTELTSQTMQILKSNPDIVYNSRHEDYGQRFISDIGLSQIENGMEVLLELFRSVKKSPYYIAELK